MAQVALTWSDPTKRVDGVALAAAEIASIDIFEDGVLIGNVPGAGTSFTTGVASVGVHNFTVVVNDTSGHRSAPSNVISETIVAVLAAPEAVTDLSGTVLP